MLILKMFGIMVMSGIVIFAFLLMKGTDSIQREIDREMEKVDES